MNEGKNTELHDFPAPNPPSPTLNKSNQSLTSFNKQYDVSLRWRKPVLSVYTRHSADCKYVRNRLYRRCSCPKWIGGRADHKRFRKSAGTRHWDIAEKYQLRLEEAWIKGLPPFSGSPEYAETQTMDPAAEQRPAVATPALVEAIVCSASFEEVSPLQLAMPRIAVETAVEAYMADARSRELRSSTISKLETTFRRQFLGWTKAKGLDYLDEIDLDALLTFRTTWKDEGMSKQKKQERLIGFFRECTKRSYISQNPAAGMRKIKFVQIPTDYFTCEEFERIIAATYICGDDNGYRVDENRTRLRAITLLLRWGGLRIGDAVTLERSRLHKDSILLYQAKTGTPVYVPLPPHVLETLNTVPSGLAPNPRYFFWSGNGDPKTAVSHWQRSYRRLFKLTDIVEPDGKKKRCHPHMFRDTFAVEMLLAGVPIDQVSLLLGHSSVRITERNYSPFVKARQIQLQESVRAAWKPNLLSTVKRPLSIRRATNNISS